MAVRVSTMKGKEKGVTYSDKDVRRMVGRTTAIPGSALRRTGADKVLKMQGRRPTKAARRELGASVREGKGGFSKPSGRSGT